MSSASSRLLPWLMQPGIEGHSAIHTPSSSRSKVMMNFMATTYRDRPPQSIPDLPAVILNLHLWVCLVYSFNASVLTPSPTRIEIVNGTVFA